MRAGTTAVSIGMRVEQRAFGLAAAKTALLVGTLLTLINHPDILRLEMTRQVILQCLLNFIVPFLVAGYSRHALLKRIATETGRS